MKKLILLFIIILLSSCTYKRNGIGKWERERWYPKRAEYQHRVNGRSYKYYTINGSHYFMDNPNGHYRRLYLYDFYYQKALEKGYNPHWYIDRNLKEGEENSSG